MDPLSSETVAVRDACPDDVPALGELRYGPVMHRDRIRDADGVNLRYLVLESDGVPVGFGCLVLGQPAGWPPMKHVPQMVDLFVARRLRSRGFGRRLIAAMESVAGAAGYAEMFLGVDPRNNPRAMHLYERLGYECLETKPVRDQWEYVDSQGVRHGGVEWTVHMRKPLAL